MRTEYGYAPRTAPSGDVPSVPPLPDAPPPRLSPLKTIVALLLLAVVVVGTVLLLRQSTTNAGATAAVAGTSAFAPYVDVTLTPTYAFQDPAANPVSGVYLGFVVADPSSPCTPSWGGFYTLGAAESALNLDERVSQVQAQGGTPIVSFGGRDNNELAVSCQSTAALTAAYLAPVSRYHLSVIDLDIEGAALTNAAANRRRALAIAAAQRTEVAHRRRLGVWLTLPVSTTGLTPAGISALRAMLAAHVELSGVNALAMDFAPTSSVMHDMLGAVEQALRSAGNQVAATYAGAGLELGGGSAWRLLGATVMIGQNDVAGEQFTLRDATQLTAFAAHHHLARLSMWSLNRDSECGSVFAQTGVLSNTCSGVLQTPLQFTRIFSALAGTNTAKAPANAPAAVPQVQQAPVDDPARSPYPIWQPTAAYVTGYKVVWHRAIYEAKWFSQGVAPDAPAQTEAQDPWLLIGPVPSGARAPAPVLLDGAKHPAWSPTAVYHDGDRVLYGGLPYQAKWYTQGDPPSSTLPADPQSPWMALFTIKGEPTQTEVQ